MSKYPLKSLLQVRLHREQNLQRETLAKKQEVEEAKLKVENALTKALEFQKQRPEEEKALFQKIKGKEVAREVIDNYHRALSNLKLQEVALFDAVEEKKLIVLEKEKALVIAQANQKKAELETRKIDEHKKIWINTEKILMEQAEEKELEDRIAKNSDYEDENQ